MQIPHRPQGAHSEDAVPGERIYRVEVGTSRRPSPIQDGWKEHLLCRKCEQRIGDWEKIACEELRGEHGATATPRATPYSGPIVLPRGVKPAALQMLEMQGCDYATWRLFQLSMLWRMDRSRLHELATVDLGEARDDVEKMLAAEDPGRPMDYPCWVYILSSWGQPTRELMTTPIPFKYKGYPAIELVFGGLGWFFIIAHDVACETMRQLVIDRTGRMPLLFVDVGSVEWLVEGIRRMAQQGNWAERTQPRRNRGQRRTTRTRSGRRQ